MVMTLFEDLDKIKTPEQLAAYVSGKGSFRIICDQGNAACEITDGSAFAMAEWWVDGIHHRSNGPQHIQGQKRPFVLYMFYSKRGPWH
jgi:hypothetical protein